MSIKQDLLRYIDAGYPIIYINSYEESKTDRIIAEVIGGRDGIEWNGADGFVKFKNKQVQFENHTLLQTLSMLDNDGGLERKILIIKDVHPYLEDRNIIAQLKNICRKINEGLDTTIIMVSPIVKIPRELEKFITILELEFLTQDEIRQQIRNFADEQGYHISDALLEEMSMAFKGLTEFEIDSLLRSALATDGEFNRRNLKLILEQKQQMIMKSGILEMIPLKEKLEDIGGLENLKEWLYRKARVYKSINKAVEFGVDMPKGVLIAGVPGCGKSLTAKVTAQLFEVPLLRLDMGKIMGKYVGESEENMRRAIALAEANSP